MRLSRILVATDFSPTARVAQRSAEALARDTGASLVLAHVVETPSGSYAFMEGARYPDVREEWLEEARRKLHAAAARSRARGARVLATQVRVGKPWVELLELARIHRADIVCLGNSGRSAFQRLLLGSTAENLIRHSPIPVLVTRSRPLDGLRRALVPVSFDEGSSTALAFAMERLPQRTEIEAFYALPPVEVVEPWFPILPPSAAETTQELESFLRAAGAERARARVVVSRDAGHAVLQRARAWKADLIVICTHGRGGLAHVLLGSVAERVARYADRPVLILPPPGRLAAAEDRVEKRPARRVLAATASGPPNPRPLGRGHRGSWSAPSHTGRGPA